MFDRHRFAPTPLVAGTTPSRPRSGAGSSAADLSASNSSGRSGARNTASAPALSSSALASASRAASSDFSSAPTSTTTYTFAASSNGPAPTSSSVGLAPRLPRSAPPLTDSGFSAGSSGRRSGAGIFGRQQQQQRKGSTGEEALGEAGAPLEMEEDTSFRQQFKTAYLTRELDFCDSSFFIHSDPEPTEGPGQAFVARFAVPRVVVLEDAGGSSHRAHVLLFMFRLA